ncbi:MAG: IS110 family transposase [Tomitella sp.]|nr:IS110 family transposase [Tomitella sp.]
MEVLHPRCAGIDIGKKVLAVGVRIEGAGRARSKTKVVKHAAMTADILALREDLIASQVTCVVMESTGDYWKPVYYLLEGGPFELIVGNAAQIRNLPGRKSDVSDASWLAQLGAHGLVRPSFVPPPPIRELRDLTRDRTALVRHRATLLNRVEKVLEEASIKLSSVASDLNGVSCRAMLDALIAGERDPQVLAGMARGRMRAKLPQLGQALTGRFSEHHAFRINVLLGQVDHLGDAVAEYDQRIEAAIEPYRWFRDLITTVPGIAVATADVITAETGADMSQFPTAKQLASWAGVTPGSNESAGVFKSAKTRKGNTHLKGALGIAAIGAARSKNTYLSKRHWRIAARRGKLKAIVATEHAILTAIWYMATTDTSYIDPGPDFFTNLHPDRAKRRALNQLKELGYDVTLSLAAG